MQMDYPSAKLASNAIALPSAQRLARDRASLPRRLPNVTLSVLRARQENARREAWETLAWLALALCSLTAIVMSLAGQ